MATETFRLVTELQVLQRQDREVANASVLLNPEAATALEMGEFLVFDANYQLVRASGASAQYVMFVERGRSDIQAIGKVTTLRGGYEAETLIFLTSAIPVLGAKLEVATTVYAAKNVSGLQTHAGGAAEVIGFVTKTAASATAYLRFIQTLV